MQMPVALKPSELRTKCSNIGVLYSTPEPCWDSHHTKLTEHVYPKKALGISKSTWLASSARLPLPPIFYSSLNEKSNRLQVWQLLIFHSLKNVAILTHNMLKQCKNSFSDILCDEPMTSFFCFQDGNHKAKKSQDKLNQHTILCL
jgi:hypothetical protein